MNETRHCLLLYDLITFCRIQRTSLYTQNRLPFINDLRAEIHIKGGVL